MQVRYQLRHRPAFSPDGEINLSRVHHGAHVGADYSAPFVSAALETGSSSGIAGQSFHRRSSE